MTTREPVLTPAYITAAVTAVLACLVAFGVDLSPEKTAGILGVVAVLGQLVSAYVGRGKVTPLVDPRDDDGKPLISVIDESDKWVEFNDES